VFMFLSEYASIVFLSFLTSYIFFCRRTFIAFFCFFLILTIRSTFVRIKRDVVIRIVWFTILPAIIYILILLIFIN
jgi:hypothetical protein